jgi:prepilin-type processing-associated H-X9-DG protein
MLLPYLDQPNLYSTINFDLGYGDRENLTARANHLDVFLCPADVRAQATPATNYAGNTGDVYPATSQNGSFSNVGEHFSFADFVDGTHSTIAASEWVKGSLGQSIGLAENIFPTPPLPTLDEFASHCANVNVTTSGFDASKGFEWIYGEMGRTLYNHVLGPNQPGCTNNGRVQQGAYSASSRHPAGVHSLFVDGHVKFISETIDLRIWRALGTRRGGESVDEF